MEFMISKIIHQIWVGPRKAPVEWMQTWKDKHPTWEFMLWDNEAVKNFPFINKDKVEDMMARGLYHGVSDVVEYEILYNFGGFVAPADSICLEPIDELLNIKEDCFTCYENERRRNKLLSLHLGTSKGCRLMAELIDFLRIRTKPIMEPWLSTGNKFITQQVNRLQYPIKVYPSHYFIPEHYTGEKYEGTDKIYARHAWYTTKILKSGKLLIDKE
jgi:mannosyltransferase OCH1-like enzyme